MNRAPLAAALVLAAASALAAAPSFAADDHLLDFGWMTDEQRAAAEAAHTALEEAEAAMCEIMVDTYEEHARRAHDADHGIAAEEIAYMKRRCVAEAFSAHIEQSTAIHDQVHREIHAGGDKHDH